MVHPEGRLGNQGSLYSLGCTLGIVGFIRGRWVHRGAPWVSSSSSRVAGFIGVRPEGRSIHPGLLGSSRYTLRVAGLIRVR